VREATSPVGQRVCLSFAISGTIGMETAVERRINMVVRFPPLSRVVGRNGRTNFPKGSAICNVLDLKISRLYIFIFCLFYTCSFVQKKAVQINLTYLSFQYKQNEHSAEIFSTARNVFSSDNIELLFANSTKIKKEVSESFYSVMQCVHKGLNVTAGKIFW